MTSLAMVALPISLAGTTFTASWKLLSLCLASHTAPYALHHQSTTIQNFASEKNRNVNKMID